MNKSSFRPRTGLSARSTAILCLASLLGGCRGGPATGASSSWRPEEFGNILDLRGAPHDSRDPTAFAFSDLGAWHMFGLPGEGTELPGSFTGPLLLAEGGIWLSPWGIRPVLEVDGDSRWLRYDPAAEDPAAYYPGRLHQAVVTEGLRMEVDLVFASARTTLLRARVENVGPDTLPVGVAWAGGGFYLPVDQRLGEGWARITLLESRGGEHAPTTMTVMVPDGRPAIEVGRPPNSAMYRIPGAPFRLGPGETADRYAMVAVTGGPGEPDTASAEPDFPPDPEAVFTANRERWQGYLEGVLGPNREGQGRAGSESRAEGESERVDAPAGASPSPHQRIAVKAVETLLSNWRAPRGGLHHAGLFPSYAYRGFHGVWSWDSWKHARALALFAPELAKDQMRVMLDHQNEAGMIPDVIYVDSTENNWRDTKPPLAAWAVEGIFRATADTAFVEEVYPALMAYHRWWYRERDHDGNGLCEYGSTDGTRIAAAWESGMDNAVRFDDAVMVENGPGAWSLNQESVDLSSYLYAEKGYLANLAEAIGRPEDASRLRAEAEVLGDLIRSTMFNQETGYFYDVELESKEPVRVQGPEGWIPLWAAVAAPEQASGVREIMMDPAKFAGLVPFPTLAMDRPEFDPLEGYWRGPVWLDQAYFGVVGLERYGFLEDADSMGSRLLRTPAGLTGDGPIYENYHPVTGEGLNAPHFSWSAAHLLLLMEGTR